MTVSNVDEMMVGVCILRGAYPHLDLQDLVEEARAELYRAQAEKLRRELDT